MAALADRRGRRRGRSSSLGIVCRSCSSSSASAIARRCATSPAIPGTAARWNGRPPRRRRCSTSPCCRDVDGEEAYWAHEAARARSSSCATRARLRGHRDAAQQPDRLRLRVLRHGHGLRADLAHLVDGGARRCSAHSPPSSCSPGATATKTPIPAARSRASTAPTGARAVQRSRPCSRRRELDGRLPADRDRRARPRPMRTLGRADPSTARACVEAHRRRLTGSGFSCSATSSCSRRSSRPTRCWPDSTAGGPNGRGAVRPAATWRSRRPACCRRASPAASRASRADARNSAHGSTARWRRPSCSALAFLAPRAPRVRRSGRARRRPDAQRLPVGVLHAGRLPRPARVRGPAVAADHDGAGLRQGLSRRHPAPHAVLRAVQQNDRVCRPPARAKSCSPSVAISCSAPAKTMRWTRSPFVQRQTGLGEEAQLVRAQHEAFPIR